MDNDKFRKITGLGMFDSLNSLQNKLNKATSFNDMAGMLSQISAKSKMFDFVDQLGGRDYNKLGAFSNNFGSAFQLNDIARQMQLQSNTLHALSGASSLSSLSKHLEWSNRFEQQSALVNSFKGLSSLSSMHELANSINQNQGLFKAQKSLAQSLSESYMTKFGQDKVGLSSFFNNGFLQNASKFKSLDVLSGNTFSWLKNYEEENDVDLEDEIEGFKQRLQRDKEFKGKIIDAISSIQGELKDLSTKVNEMERDQVDDLDGIWVKLINKYITEPLGLPKWAPAIVLFVVMFLINNVSQEEPVQINQNFNIQVTPQSKPTERIFEKFYDVTNSKTTVFLRKSEKTKKIATIENQTEVEILMIKGEWCYIQFSVNVKLKKKKELVTKELRGWIKKRFLDSYMTNDGKEE